jgi:hypothetical protein
MALMANITYAPAPAVRSKDHPMLDVFLDGAYAGTIFRRSGPREAFYYRPKRTMATSKDYRTIDELKASLQGS